MARKKSVGRPRLYAGGTERINVTLDRDTVRLLKRAGGGQLSLGIRRAAALVQQQLDEQWIQSLPARLAQTDAD